MPANTNHTKELLANLHLLIEVADKTPPRDRGAKKGGYARAGIP